MTVNIETKQTSIINQNSGLYFAHYLHIIWIYLIYLLVIYNLFYYQFKGINLFETLISFPTNKIRNIFIIVFLLIIDFMLPFIHLIIMLITKTYRNIFELLVHFFMNIYYVIGLSIVKIIISGEFYVIILNFILENFLFFSNISIID